MFDPWAGKIPWRRKWQPTPVFLPGESHGWRSHGWRSLVGYSPRGCKESDTTERLHFHFMMIFTLLQWSGTKPAISLRCACIVSVIPKFLPVHSITSTLRALLYSCLCFPRQWHPTPVLLPGKSHGRRSMVGCSPWGCKELDTT